MSGFPQPVAFQGSLQLAADQSLPQDPIPFSYSGQYVALVAELANPAGSGTINVPFGSVGSPGAKGLLVRYDAQQPVGAAPAMLTLNGGNQAIELTPGSLFVYFNASPTTGLTAATIAITAACQLRIWVLG